MYDIVYGSVVHLKISLIQLIYEMSTCISYARRMSTSQWPLAAVCQVTATPDKAANFSACSQLVEEAKERGATMVFLPEGFDYIGSSREETLSLSEPLTGDMITQYSQLARWERPLISISVHLPGSI